MVSGRSGQFVRLSVSTVESHSFSAACELGINVERAELPPEILRLELLPYGSDGVVALRLHDPDASTALKIKLSPQVLFTAEPQHVYV